MALDLGLKYLIHIEDAIIKHHNQTIFDKVSFKLAEAEFVYLVGKSGSGKSTLIKSLYGACPIEAKIAKVAGYDLMTLTKHSIPEFRRKLGIVFQEFHLFQNWSIYDNLEFVLKATGWTNKEDMSVRIGKVLHQVKLDNVNPRDRVYSLSGGQKQKTAIARAMLNQPEIIIADEATGNLDPEASDEILRLLHEISAEYKTSILFATHDSRLMNRFPARTVICEGNELQVKL